MRKIDVVCATLGTRVPTGLQHLPFTYRYLASTEPGWGEAANALLDKTENDVLFLDDDIEILPSTFDAFEKYYDEADMFGFSLIGPFGQGREWVQSAGQMLVPNGDGLSLSGLDGHIRALMLPCYTAHVGTCCCYIKREVVAAGIRFPLWSDGIHYEDVAFCLDVWLSGFKCLRLPFAAIHHGAENGAGIHKGNDPRFAAKRAINEVRLSWFMEQRRVLDAVMEGRIPMAYRFLQPFEEAWSIPIGGPK